MMKKVTAMLLLVLVFGVHVYFAIAVPIGTWQDRIAVELGIVLGIVAAITTYRHLEVSISLTKVFWIRKLILSLALATFVYGWRQVSLVYGLRLFAWMIIPVILLAGLGYVLYRIHRLGEVATSVTENTPFGAGN